MYKTTMLQVFVGDAIIFAPQASDKIYEDIKTGQFANMQVENCLVSVSKCSWIYGKRKGRGDEEGRNGRKRGDREEETDG